MTIHKRYKKIVVPLDGSGWSQRAVPHAVDIARSNDSELILLHVFRPPAYEYTDQIVLAGQEEQIETYRQQMERYLTGICNELRVENLNVTMRMIEGQGAANLICDFVTAENVDLIVMCTHGRSGIVRFFFGSVAAKVMQCAKVPVLLVHPDQEGG